MSSDGIDLKPRLTYSDEPTAHVSAQSLDVELTSGLLELAEHEGGVSTECFIARQAIRSVLDGDEVDKAMKVTVNIEPISEEERVNR